MGASKATLPWHGSTLVRRVAGIVSRGVDGPVVLVRSPGQSLPVLPAGFEVVEDLEEGKGPLAGLSVGLAELEGRCEAVYVSSTDVPFLHPAFVRAVVAELGPGFDACVPCVRGFTQPLAAAYLVSLAPVVKGLLSADRLRVSHLFEACRGRELEEAALLANPDVARWDPGLESLTNLNDPHEYEVALARPLPSVRVRHLFARERCRDEATASAATLGAAATARAATLGAAATAIGVTLGPQLEVVLNGDNVPADPEEPLAEGDLITFVGEGAPS